MTFRTGIRIKVPTSKQLSGMAATRRLPTWYAADYFPQTVGHPGAGAQPAPAPALPEEHRMQGRLGQNDENAMLPRESCPREGPQEQDAISVSSDAQEDSSFDICSIESEVADPSWVPPPVDTLMNRMPLRTMDRRHPERKLRRPLTNGQKGGATIRALGLRSRTIVMGAQIQGGERDYHSRETTGCERGQIGRAHV